MQHKECHFVVLTYWARGAIPLAFPRWWPQTTTGTPWFPAATEAVWLHKPTNISTNRMVVLNQKHKSGFYTYVPCPSPSNGEASSWDEFKTPLLRADSAKWRAPTSFLLQEPEGKPVVTSQTPVNRGGTGYECPGTLSLKLGWVGSIPVSINPITTPSPAYSEPPSRGQAPRGKPKNCGVWVVAFLTG